MTAPAPAPKTAPAPKSAASKLNALRAEAAPLIDRLARVDADIAELNATPASAEGGSLDDQISARQSAAAKISDLTVERDVIQERLAPMQAEIAALEKMEEAERIAADRQRSLDMGQEALARVAKAREALEAEIAAMSATSKMAPVRWNMLPEFYFAAQPEIAKCAHLARLLGAAAS